MSYPRRNQRTRSSEEPCVHESGLTVPLDRRCSRSSPTAAAAPTAESMSPASSRSRCWVEWAQIPAKQSAWSSSRTEAPVAPCVRRMPSTRWLIPRSFCTWWPISCAMNVRLRELPARPELVAELPEEAEVDVDPFVGGAIERPRGGVAEAAARLRGVREENELRVAIGNAQPHELIAPGGLHVVEDERDEVDLGRLGLGPRLRRRRSVHALRADAAAQDSPRDHEDRSRRRGRDGRGGCA